MVRRFLLGALCVMVMGAPISFAATFTVTTTADSGPGSLRQAIVDANSSAGADDIRFNIGGGGPQIIAVASNLPNVTDTVVIDGTTQPGFSGTPIITLDGNAALGHGLTIFFNPAPSTIRGLVIVDFGLHGISVQGGGATIVGNYIGVDASGLVANGNAQGGINVGENTDGVVIGGLGAQDRNVISANGGNGIQFLGLGGSSTSDDNIVQGNIIGLDATGSIALGNAFNGVAIDGGDRNQIGGTAAGAGNIIAGNDNFGIRISSLGTALPDRAVGNTVQGNLVGTNIAGTAAVPNGIHGVAVFGAQGTTIGGAAAGARNVISGNVGAGVNLAIVSDPFGLWLAEDSSIVGNLIGTDITGTVNLGNGGGGVFLTAALNTTIGGSVAGAGNVISGNPNGGIIAFSFFDFAVTTPTSGTVISRNHIGTDISGTSAIPNGGGISMAGTQNSTIGGPVLSNRNVISGNTLNGIVFFEHIGAAPTTGNVVQGNLIGTDASGTIALPNSDSGVLFTSLTNPSQITGNTIGGTGAGEGNTIWFNGGDGIRASGGPTGNRFLRNSIDLNGRLGINLGDDGVTANDAADADTGPNNLQNYPVLTSANLTVSTNVIGTLHSTAGRTFRLEFFNSPAADPSGFGEGRIFLGSLDVTTDGAGNAAIATSLPGVAAGTVITATATDLTSLDTSEFSNAATVVFVPPILNISDVTVVETDSGTTNAIFTVSISEAAPTDVTFEFATANGSAIAPGDYATTAGSGVIPAGDLSTTISVPVVGDFAIEPDETFFVNVTNIQGAVGGDVQGQATIANDDTTSIPTLTQWGLLLMALFLGIGGAMAIRR